jgi:hypothetical protein
MMIAEFCIFSVFLSEWTPRPLALPGQGGFEPKALYIGRGQNALEVVVVDAVGQPSGGTLKAALEGPTGRPGVARSARGTQW